MVSVIHWYQWFEKVAAAGEAPHGLPPILVWKNESRLGSADSLFRLRAKRQEEKPLGNGIARFRVLIVH
jgi:hypothetical protein